MDIERLIALEGRVGMEVSKFFITQEVPIREAIRQLDQTAKKLLVVVEQKRLIGVITDGDIRRWILKNKDLSLPVRLIMNTKPIFLKKEDSPLAFELMQEKQIEGIPLIDDGHEVTDIIFWNERKEHKAFDCNACQTPVTYGRR